MWLPVADDASVKEHEDDKRHPAAAAGLAAPRAAFGWRLPVEQVADWGGGAGWRVRRPRPPYRR